MKTIYKNLIVEGVEAFGKVLIEHLDGGWTLEHVSWTTIRNLTTGFAILSREVWPDEACDSSGFTTKGERP